MTSVKVNIFISHAAADKPVVEKLLEWLYPMRDEVNVWHYDPPQKLKPLPLPWRLLLPWFRPVDPRVLYAEVLKKRRENAHIYVFLKSDKSLQDDQFDADITLALNRRVDCENTELAPLILPVALNPAGQSKTSRLARFEPLADGLSLDKFVREEDAYLRVTEQISALVKVIQVRLNETRFYQYYPENLGNTPAFRAENGLPYLGEDPDQFEFNPPAPFNPPEWAGWSLMALIFMISAGSFRKNDSAVSALHLKARPDGERGMEFPRKIPMAPPPDSIKLVFPPVE